MHVGSATVQPLKVELEVGGTKNTNVEGINKLVNAFVKEPVSNGRVSCRALLWLELELGSSGQMRRASSGHWRSAALCVKKMVSRPSVSTMAMRRLCCLNQYCLVPRRLEA